MNLPNSTISQTGFLRSSPSAFFTKLPFASNIERRRRHNLFRTLDHTLDRVNVLGDDGTYGHTGCVNALSWAQDGDILLSAGDDTTVRIWRVDLSSVEQDYPFICRSVINTGHRANIFSAKMLPMSSRIATGAGDSQIRIFDVPAALNMSGCGDIEANYSTNQNCIRIIRCHHDAVKKIITEESPDLFLSVSEDGSVRQHDLRTSHTCGTESCPGPLVDIGHELFVLSLSSLVPYQFVVAGEGPYGYLFDRRYLRRTMEHDWGMVPRAGKEATTCVRKFGRDPRTSKDKSARRDHITGARMSKSNGHEVLLSYSGDSVYLFSTKDEPTVKEDLSPASQSLLHPNTELPSSEPRTRQMMQEDDDEEDNDDQEQGPSPHRVILNVFDHLISTSAEGDYQPDFPVVLPRRCYTGARNVMTLKDVNFLGPEDEWVVSGSDDGNFFMWNKDSGSIQGIYEGDSSVVNVIEGHPHFPLVAVSGIDTTVKLFAPTLLSSSFSRMGNAEQIVNNNRRLGSRRFRRYDILSLFREDPDSMSSRGIPTRATECIDQ